MNLFVEEPHELAEEYINNNIIGVNVFRHKKRLIRSLLYYFQGIKIQTQI